MGPVHHRGYRKSIILTIQFFPLSLRRSTTTSDAPSLIEEQRSIRGNEDDPIFPYYHRSAGTAFTRACQELRIADLHFHDLRHEATSRLFEAGFRIEQVALVTGHKDWKMLRRYTHLRPESLHDLPSPRAA